LPEDTVQIPTLASARRFFVHGSIKKSDLPKYPERTSKLVAFMDVEIKSPLVARVAREKGAKKSLIILSFF
jgi:hypothetical protein